MSERENNLVCIYVCMCVYVISVMYSSMQYFKVLTRPFSHFGVAHFTPPQISLYSCSHIYIFFFKTSGAVTSVAAAAAAAKNEKKNVEYLIFDLRDDR
jgi:hypothetical protein